MIQRCLIIKSECCMCKFISVKSCIFIIYITFPMVMLARWTWAPKDRSDLHFAVFASWFAPLFHCPLGYWLQICHHAPW